MKNPLCGQARPLVFLPSILVTISIIALANALTFEALNVPGASFTSADDVNASGVIVGHYYSVTNQNHGFVYDGTTYSSFDYPGASRTHAYGINDAGQIVGTYSLNFFDHGFLIDGKTKTSVDVPNAFSTAAWDINNHGDIVGDFYDNESPRMQHGFLYDASTGTFTALDYPGARRTFAYHLNDFGVVVGTYVDSSWVVHGFLYDGGYTSLDYPGAKVTNANGINNLGVVVGRYSDQNNVWHGFIYEGGSFTSLDVDFPGATYSQLIGIDELGNMVGRYIGPFGVAHGFLAIAVPPKISVPELRGLEQNAAVTTIVQAGLVTGRFIWKAYSPFVPAGEVITQWPAPGTLVERDSVVEMTVSRGPSPNAEQATVNVNGQQLQTGLEGDKGITFGASLPVVIDYGMPIANVRVSIDGEAPFEATPADLLLLRWWFNVSGLEVSEHEIEIEAVDENGTILSTFESSFFVQELDADVRFNGQPLADGPSGPKGVPFGDPLPLLIDYPLQVANVRVSIDGQAVPFEATSPDGSLRHWWLSLSGLQAGEHELLIEALDESGNKLSTFETPFTLLEVASTVRIGGRQIASGEGGTKGVPFGPLIPVVVDYAHPVANVRVSINGQDPYEMTPYDFDLTNWWLNLQQLPPGDHRVKIEAFDEMNNTLSSYETRIFVEQIASDVRVNGHRLESGQDGFKGVPFSDPMQIVVEYEQPVSNVRISVDDRGLPVEAEPVVPGDLTRWFVNLSGVGAGLHDLRIKATDSEGLVVSAFNSPVYMEGVESVVAVNGTTISSGLNGHKGVPFGDPLPIRITYNREVANVRLSLDGQLPFEVRAQNLDLRNWSINLSGVSIGEHRLIIEAFDNEGHKVSVFDSPVFVQEIGSRVTIGGNEIPSGRAGNKGIRSSNVVPIIADFDQAVANVRIRLDGHPAFELTPTDLGLRRYFFNWSDPDPGPHRVEIEAFDGEGQKVSAYQTDLWIFRAFRVVRAPDGGLQISWEGKEILQRRSGRTGQWVDLPNATSPFNVTVDPEQITELFRVRAP